MRWDELTPTDFLAAREKSGRLCVLPVASIERHGNHMPLGTDSFVAEEVCRRAAKNETFVWFPVMRLGVNGEAAANPGAIALKTETIFALLANLCEEFARNGFEKILLYSTHGGNGHGLPFFVQQAMLEPRGYLPYYFTYGYGKSAKPATPLPEVRSPGGHGGQYETSAVMAAAPGLVKTEQVLPSEKADKLGRLNQLLQLGVYSPVNYYSNYPYHWAAPCDGACKEVGDEVIDERAERLSEVARAIKADTTSPALWQEYLARMAAGGTLEPSGPRIGA